jgi:rhamnulokinase
MSAIVAFDLGATSGRALLGKLRDKTITVEELHRFPNDPVHVGDRLHWDALRLYHEMKQALLKAKHQGVVPESVAIDSWAVDFGLIGKNGELLGNPYHYRDSHTDGMMEQLFTVVPREELFARTGIQFLPFNTVFQLYALKRADSPLLREAERLLMMPDLFRYFLTGDMHAEFTNATTTQLYNPVADDWDRDLIGRLGFAEDWFVKAVKPGTEAGRLRESVRRELGLPAIPVIAAAEHDTASAVAAIPAAERSFAYLISGTWSLMGTEVPEPVLGDQALRFNFTNEGGVGSTFRLLKNIMGLWLLEECRRDWEKSGLRYGYGELMDMAGNAPAFPSLIDPDDPVFLPAGGMTERIRAYCRQTGQLVPDTPGEIVRCIMESLALKYRLVLEMTEKLSGRAFGGLHMTGGGIKNEWLCQLTANSIGKPVWAGPAEGSGIGNLAVQWMAAGAFRDIWEARAAIRDSFPLRTYEPADRDVWDEAYGRFLRVTGLEHEKWRDGAAG